MARLRTLSACAGVRIAADLSMTVDLTTTNVLLGIMAAVSLLEAAAVVGLLVATFMLLRAIARVAGAIESKHVAPAAARLNAILDDVKEVTTTVSEETKRADAVLHTLWAAFGR
jgi:hypothetical protein